MTAAHKHHRDTWSIIRSLAAATTDPERRSLIGSATLTTVNCMYLLIRHASPRATRYMAPASLTRICSRIRGFHPNPDFLIKIPMIPGITRHSIREILRAVLTDLDGLPPDDRTLIIRHSRVMLETGPSVHKLVDNLQRQCDAHVAGHPRPCSSM